MHLEGHKCIFLFMMADGVMTVEWSTSSEWVLVTGGCDGAIRFWDIRRAGCFLVLDQSQSQLGRRPPILKRSATIKVFFFSLLHQSICFQHITHLLCELLCLLCFFYSYT